MLLVFSISCVVVCVCFVVVVVFHQLCLCSSYVLYPMFLRGHLDRDHMVIGFTTTRVISAYHQYSCEFEYYSWLGILDTTLYDKVCQ